MFEEPLERVVGDDELRSFPPQAAELKLGARLPQRAGKRPAVNISPNPGVRISAVLAQIRTLKTSIRYWDTPWLLGSFIMLYRTMTEFAITMVLLTDSANIHL